MLNLKKKLVDKLFNFISKKRDDFRRFFFQLKSDNKIAGNPKISQPTLFLGSGKIVFGNDVQIGYFPSPYFYSGYGHIEARAPESKIQIGNNTIVNNNIVIISEEEIIIGDNVLIGTNVEIIDSDFHSVSADRNIKHKTAPVNIKSNVWIGSNVKILKGVTIGENSIISNSSVVTKNIPSNTIAGGIPAKIIKEVND
jgi:acetyltransferase-like isoleucine patch superfamily enzyme